jgi:hypothetical protein
MAAGSQLGRRDAAWAACSLAGPVERGLPVAGQAGRASLVAATEDAGCVLL